MKLLFKSFTVLLLAVLFTGCVSTKNMPLQSAGLEEKAAPENSILFGKIRVNNINKPGHQPKLTSVVVEENGKSQVFANPTLLSESREEGKDYFFSIDSAPGKANIKTINFFRQVPLLVMAMAQLQLETEIEVPENKIVYLGNIDASIKPRQEGQPRAGSVIPLIDQAVAGFSNGAFEVTVSDNSEEDLKAFLKQFPYMQDKEVVKSILPSWTHPKER